MSWPDEPFLNLRQTATPKGDAPNGGQLVYVKSDGKLYTKINGVESTLGAGGDVTLTGTQTLTNKTLTTPRIDRIQDTGGRPILNLLPSGLAVNNYLEVRNANGTSPALAAVGNNTNVNLNLVPKGTGTVQAKGTQVADISTAQTLTNKTLSTGTLVGGATTDISAAWTAYTPAWTASTTNPTIGNGTITGSYVQIGKTVHFRVNITIGSTSTVGSGNYSVSLPVAAHATGLQVVRGDGFSSGGSTIDLRGRISAGGSTVALFCTPTTAGAFDRPVTSLTPFGWNATSVLTVCGTYEAA